MNLMVRCYVCGLRVPRAGTALMRHRVKSGAVRTRSAFTCRMVRRCVPYCDSSSNDGSVVAP